jgi:hypothetical protein
MALSAIVNVIDQSLALYVTSDVLKQRIRVHKIVVLRGDFGWQIARIALYRNDIGRLRFEKVQI